MPEQEPLEAMQELQATIEAARSGVEAAESIIHKTFVNRLVGLSSKYIAQRYRSKVDPEDVVQSVFRSFFRQHRQGDFVFEGRDDIWLLLARITVRKSISQINSYRTDKRNLNRELVASDDCTPSVFFGAGAEPTPDDTAVFNDLLDQLFDQLPENLREVVVLRLQGLTNLEISQSMKCSLRTVCRSISKIRTVFEQFET